MGVPKRLAEARAGHAPFDGTAVSAIRWPQQLNVGGTALAPGIPENAIEQLQSTDFDRLAKTPIR